MNPSFSTSLLSPLPKLFEGSHGKVDPEFLKKLCMSAEQPGKRIRELLTDYHGFKLRPKEDVYIKFSESINNTGFRENWYLGADSGRKKLTSLFFLAEKYVRPRHPNFGFDSHHLSNFFEKRLIKGKEFTFPILGEMSIFVEQLESAGKSSPLDAALYAWSLIERTKWSATNFPTEESLCDFELTLRKHLRPGTHDDILELLSTPEWEVHQPLSCLTDSSSSAAFSKQHIPFDAHLSPQETPEAQKLVVQKHQFQTEVEDNLSKIETFVEEYERRLTCLVSKTAELNRSITPDRTLKDVSTHLGEVREALNALDRESKILLTFFGQSISEALEQVKLTVDMPNIDVLLPHQFNEWAQIYKKNVLFAIPVLTVLDELSRKSHEVVTKVKSNVDCRKITFDELPTFAIEFSFEIQLVEKGLRAAKKFESHISSNFLNFAWNPLEDSLIRSSDWDDFGKFLIHEGELNTRLGIAMRKEYSLLSDAFVNKLPQLVQEIDEPILRKILLLFRCLTLGQIEGLDRNSKIIKPLLAVVELHAYLELASTSTTDAFVYWSASPLNQYATQPAIDSFSLFFQNLFAVCGENSEPRLSLSNFRVRLTRARTKLISTEIESDHDSLIARLNTILRHYKRGGNTYAELWSQAYASLLAPLKRKINEGRLQEILLDIEKLRSEFEIEDHLVSWKLSIPEHLRKRSEYDKQIRFQVASKIDELAAWADAYTALTNIKDKFKSNNDEQLDNVIRMVYGSQDSNCRILQVWFDIVLSGQKNLAEIPWCPSRSKNSNLDLVINFFKENALHPRTILASRPTFLTIFADKLISSYGLNTTRQLASAYSDQKLYEMYFALTADSEDDISPDLDRRVEAEVDEMEYAQQQRISALQTAQNSLTTSNDEIRLYILDLNNYLREHRWTVLEKELTEVERLVANLKIDSEQEKAREQLCLDITRLGGVVPSISDMPGLEAIHRALLEKLAPRRKHIEPLKTFLKLEGMAAAVALSAASVISQLEKNVSLPSVTHSEYLSYVLEQAVQPLSNELKRNRTLLPSYSNKLKVLTLALISHISEPQFLSDEASPLLRFLEDTTDVWKDLSSLGEEGIDILFVKFASYGLTVRDVSRDGLETWPKSSPVLAEGDSIEGRGDNSYQIPNSDSAIARLIDKMKAMDASKLSKARASLSSDTSLAVAIQSGNWAEAATSAYALYSAIQDFTSSRSFDMLTNWVVCMFRWDDSKFDDEDYATMFHLINRAPTAMAVKSILPTKNSKGLAGEIVARFFARITRSMNFDTEKLTIIDLLQAITTRISTLGQSHSLFKLAFSPIGQPDSLMVRSFWDHFSGDARQAEARAELMNLFWQSSVPGALACCLTYNPIDIPRRKAYALANIADQALATGKFDLLQSFLDLRKTISSKPFQIFVNMMLMRAPIQTEHAAQLAIVGKIEQALDGIGLSGILSITPRKSDCPDTIFLTLSALCPLRFAEGALEATLVGPFIEPTLHPVEFILVDKNASVFTVDVGCSVISITGKRSRFSTDLHIDLANSRVFTSLSSDELDDAFGGFPEYQMRGTEYVQRRDDERKIEKSLFGSKTVRSLWISSPRRSGKTTMLYKILDSYSHKAGRDNVVVYLTLDKSFSNSEDFNSWIWKRLRSTLPNKELRELYPNFDELGKNLPWTADSGTFVGALADELLRAKILPNRVIFLIDEADKFASMYFSGAERREAATDIMWQLRQLIGERRDIGFVFAGSSAAKRIFVTNSDAPYFNGITLLELTPFSCKSPLDEASAREIVEPQKLAGFHTMPKQSLEHLLWVCAGIPYYMKLVAGATFSVVKQSHILISDINDGLRALLSKSTGVAKLDDMSGDPGSDELRTMAIETGEEKLLTLAVLYSVAEAHSPLGGHRILRANIVSQDSPMVSRYRIPKKMIDRGLELSIELGLLKVSSDKIPEIDFAIPILGESIRHACGRLWSSIDHELDALGNKGATTND